VQIPAQTTYSTSQSWAAAAMVSPPQQAPVDGTSVIISQGMLSPTGDIYSQGMMAQSGPWAGQIYSQGMEMPGGDIYSQGMQITIPGPSAYSPPPSINPPPPPAPPGPPAANNSMTFAIPDAGAPSGRFSFFMGCPKNDTDPFNQTPCALGAANTELAPINTLAEVSFGCMFPRSQPTGKPVELRLQPRHHGSQFPQLSSQSHRRQLWCAGDERLL
jgi:hypothetical protein